MQDLKQFKAIAEQMLELIAEQLRLISLDEEERYILIESAKKTPLGMCYISQA